ncbi:MAG: CsgG/HfaB family protein, partial [Candidatus Binatia bacterium]
IGLTVIAPCFLFSCAAFVPMPVAPSPPQPPVRPRTARQTLEMVVNTDPVLNFNQVARVRNVRSATFAVMDFVSPVAAAQEGSTGGALVSDTFYISLAQRAVNIIERERIKKVVAEQELIRKSKSLSDQEKAKRIGRILGADYMIFGAVSEYKSEIREVTLGSFIPEKERQRYEADYQAYQHAYADYQAAQAEYIKDIEQYNRTQALLLTRARIYPQFSGPQIGQLRVLSLEEWEGQILDRGGRRVLATVASIGITARVIDVRTGKIIWVGQGAKRHLQLQEGTQILVNKLVETILMRPGGPSKRTKP